MISKEQFLERERRWAIIAGIASVAGVALILASFGASASGVRTGTGIADRLLEIDSERGALLAASIVQAIGWSMLAIPLVYLFKAASARAPQVRRGLIGVIIVAPLFLGLGSLLSANSVLDAATQFKDVPATQIQTCVGDKQDEAASTSGDEAAPSTTDQIEECRDEAARDARTGAPLASLETGLGLAGLVGFTIAGVYCSLWGMRTGLLTRFWGSLGLALGAVFIFFTLFTLIWFIYLGLLFAGWVPGGRPPAWAAGEAMPWPKGAGAFGAGRPDDDQPGGGAVLEGSGEPVEDGTEAMSAPEPGEAPQIERRKRKKRSG
jgi:MFS family permease